MALDWWLTFIQDLPPRCARCWSYSRQPMWTIDMHPITCRINCDQSSEGKEQFWERERESNYGSNLDSDGVREALWVSEISLTWNVWCVPSSHSLVLAIALGAERVYLKGVERWNEPPWLAVCLFDSLSSFFYSFYLFVYLFNPHLFSTYNFPWTVLVLAIYPWAKLT